jgi:hypothetical protein
MFSIPMGILKWEVLLIQLRMDTPALTWPTGLPVTIKLQITFVTGKSAPWRLFFKLDCQYFEIN